ncbi:MAG: ABC transporter ATP-binding protein [Bacteroidetes bacterium]|nr:MAG: ABC transporter ATP-binding protein [Bacteroidota bacterium]
MLRAVDIHKSYGKLKVLKGVSMLLEPGEIVTLVGASGAGKSTLLQILGTLDKPDTGKVLFDKLDVSVLNDRQQAGFRNRSVGFVFQFHHLLPEFTALENVCMPAFIGGMPREQAILHAKKLLGRLGLAERLHHKPSELSGGEQQRVSVARALINQPRIILADEPTGNLDSRNSDELYSLMFDLARSMGVGFLIATHNQQLAEKADRCLKIQDGVLV